MGDEALARENYLHSTRRAMLGREWDELTIEERSGWLARARPASCNATMGLRDLLRDYRDGDDHGWDVEFAWLWECHAGRLMTLLDSIEAEGILTPITLGSDGRVWDGHHRLCVAWKLGLDSVPVTLNPD